jgi:EmrB/QacA subfamily drug resistance transporter
VLASGPFDADAVVRCAVPAIDPATFPAARRPWVLAATALAAFAATVMATAVNVVLPTLARELDAPFATVQWVVLSYLLASIALVPMVGRVGDMWGKQRLFMAGHAAFGVGSLLCALAPDVATLIAFRTVQGVGSAALTALGMAILTDVYPPQARGRAIGINGAVISAGIVLGPSLGGVVADLASWRLVFVVGVVVAVAGAILAARVLPAYPRTRGERFDLLGALLLFGALMALSLALTMGQARGFDDGWILGLFVASFASAGLFVAVEQRVASPIVDLRLFRDPALSIGLLTGLMTFVAISGVIFLMPFYLGGVLGYPPAQIGLLMAVVPLVLVVMAPIAGILADRFGPRPITVVGMLLLVVGYLAVATLDEHTTPAGYVLRFLPVGLGMGTFQTPNNTAIMGAARRGASGVTGGLLALTRSLGAVIGTVVLGSAWAARAVARAGAPTGSDATLLPGSAQVSGLHDVIAIVQVMILVGLGLVATDLLRRRRDGSRRRSPPTDVASPGRVR